MDIKGYPQILEIKYRNRNIKDMGVGHQKTTHCQHRIIISNDDTGSLLMKREIPEAFLAD